ncbi:MAG TPA: DUF4156 domain-containing protein [Rhodanobacteraceae bacterium]
MRKILLLPLLATVTLAGCSWGIKLTDAGHQISTDWTGNMSDCRQLGKVTVSVEDHLGPINRNPIKVRDELEVMARNQAATMQGANTVHPLAEPAGGSQVWGVYQCGPITPAGQPAVPATSRNSGTQTFPIGANTH